MKKTVLSLLLCLFLPLSTPSWARQSLTEEEKIANEILKEEALRSSLSRETTQTVEYDYWSEFFRMLLILSAIIALLLFSSWFLKRLMNTRLEQINKLNAIKVLEKRVLSQKAVAYLLEVQGKQLVVGESPAGLQCLCEIPLTPSEGIPHELDKTSFEQVIQRKIQQERT